MKNKCNYLQRHLKSFVLILNIAVIDFVPLDTMDIAVKSHAGTQDLALVVKRYVIADRVCAIT